MQKIQDRVIVVTGAGSGIGKGIVEAFANAGAKLVITDIDQSSLDVLDKELRDQGTEVLSVGTDVANSEDVKGLAQKTYDAFGACHVICNNAGVVENNVNTWELTTDDWEWVLGVNLNGVIHGINAFVPRMLASGEEGHVVNTASIGGLIAGLALPAYSVSKHAVVALSECLYNDLAREQSKVNVSVLCPGWINTNIADSDRNRANKPTLTPALTRSRNAFKQSISNGLAPAQVGEIVLNGVLNNRFYLYTHPEWNNVIEDRFEAILKGEKPASTYLPRA
ncbi:MAG: SDR family NAD(P)-dependent oxidoreductase [Pseudomonadota bacterium]